MRVESPGVEWSAVAFEPGEDLPVGSKVYVIGHPAGLGWMVTQGILSGGRRGAAILHPHIGEPRKD